MTFCKVFLFVIGSVKAFDFTLYYVNELFLFITVFSDKLDYNIDILFFYTYINDKRDVIRESLHLRI